ncbi:MAG: hypothetical protein HQK51_20735 [Oligoflexia bacterium]|nr:hypothetical protein [Oligoflexia bacterium]
MELQLDLPKKSYFKIEEICTITDIDLNFLKLLESQFSEITPIMSSSGQRYYEEKDIEIVLALKILIMEEECSIEIAKQKLVTLLKDRELLMSYILDNNFSWESESESESEVEDKNNNNDGIAPITSDISSCFIVQEQQKQVVDISSPKILPEILTSMDNNCDKLLLVKDKLQELKLYMNSIKAKHNWSS